MRFVVDQVRPVSSICIVTGALGDQNNSATSGVSVAITQARPVRRMNKAMNCLPCSTTAFSCLKRRLTTVAVTHRPGSGVSIKNNQTLRTSARLDMTDTSPITYLQTIVRTFTSTRSYNQELQPVRHRRFNDLPPEQSCIKKLAFA